MLRQEGCKCRVGWGLGQSVCVQKTRSVLGPLASATCASVRATSPGADVDLCLAWSHGIATNDTQTPDPTGPLRMKPGCLIPRDPSTNETHT